ncbi:MAG: hypothetical protein HC895_12430 [Leptolyngbyaceae cyanobacterium SM1_3_5]|nr:hypothetical protein [Leptolyngbyaceae cyanobacterium SM1_3_5]
MAGASTHSTHSTHPPIHPSTDSSGNFRSPLTSSYRIYPSLDQEAKMLGWLEQCRRVDIPM